MAIAAGGAMLFSGVAQAKTVNEAFLEAAEKAGSLGQERLYRVEDDDRANLDTDVAETIDGESVTGTVNTGDIITGTFDITSVIENNDGATASVAETDVFGRYAFKVASKNESNGTVSYEPVGNSSLNLTGEAAFDNPNTIVQIFQNGSDDFNLTSTGGNTADGFNSSIFDNSDLWADLGFQSNDENRLNQYDITFDQTFFNGVPDYASQIGFNGDMADLTARLQILDDGTASGEGIGSLPIADLGVFDPGNTGELLHDVQFSGDILGGSGFGTDFGSRAGFNVNATVVPSPAGVTGGVALLSMLGVAGFVRRKRQNA
jgi:hypothetical protein